MFARFTFRKINSVASRLSSWGSNSNTLSKSGAKGNKRRPFITHWLGNRTIPKFWHSKRALLVVVLLASSAAALTSFGIRRAMLSGNAAAFVSQSVPATMIAGEAYAVTVKMLNQGTTTWTPGQKYRLGSQNPHDNTIWLLTTNRVNLLPGDSVSPGATTTFSFVVTAPSNPGSYNFQWGMVQELVEWFGASTPNVAVQVVPRPALTKLKEYVYAGGRLISSEEKSCVPALSPAGASPSKDAQTGYFDFSISSGCNWTATPSASWITITGGSSGTGGGQVNYSVAANDGPQRNGTITVNGQSFNITQAPNPSSCAYSLNVPGVSVSEQARSDSFMLTADGGCPWTASSNASWLTITSPTIGAGSATINYSVAANAGGQRAGSISITVGGQTFATFTVTQDPNQASCTFALNPSSWSYPVEGGDGSFNVTTGAGCRWTAASNHGWVTITGGAIGVGNGAVPVSFTVQTNTGGSRTGTISVQGQSFTITQCGYQLSHYSAAFNSTGGTGSFSVSCAGVCSWSAVSNAEWIQITSGASGAGNGTVSFSVPSSGGVSRTGTISVQGQSFTITQCSYQFSPAGQTFFSAGGSEVFSVSTASYCSWSAVSDSEWIRVPQNTIGTGNGDVYYLVTGFSGPGGSRSGSIYIGGQVFGISQYAPYGLSPSMPTGINQSATNAEPRGLTARYFSNTTLNGQPTLQRIDPVVNFNWIKNLPDTTLKTDSFSVRWDGRLSAPSSEAYTFYLSSDDGARLWVNNQLVIDRWQSPFELETRSAPVELKAGAKADIRLEYYNVRGEGLIRLMWGSDSTPKQIIPSQQLYPEAATDKSTPTDANKQTGMLLPPGSDAGPKAARSQPGEWPAIPLGRSGLILLIAGAVLALLLLINWRQTRGRFTMAAAGIVLRLRGQIASRLEELFRIAAAVSDKLQFVAVFSKRLLAGTCDKLNVAALRKRLLAGASDKLKFADFGKRLLARTCDKLQFVGHFLAAFPPVFRVVSHGGAVLRLGKQKLVRLLPERVRTIAGQALSLWRSSGVARLKPVLRRALVLAIIVRLALPLTPAQADGLVRAAQATWREACAYTSATANRYGTGSGSDLLNRLINMVSGTRPGKVVSAASQAEQVTDLQVCPTQLIMFVGERYTLTPVALNGSQQVVHGVGMSWNSFNGAVAGVSSFGQVEAVAAGTTSVEVQCGAASKQIPVEVRSGTRPTGSNQEADLDPTNDCAAEQSSAYAPQSVAVADAQQSLIPGDDVQLDWDPAPVVNSLATHFRNAVGNPRFTARSRGGGAVPTSAQLGSYNYHFNVPVAGVGGRGAGAGIGMRLNSRVWHTDNGKLTFNYVGAYPAPGWTMGYGKIIRNYNYTATGDWSGLGSGNSPGDYLLVAGDGTRTRLAAKYDAAAGRWFHESDDGSFLKFDHRSGEMRHPDGTRTVYSSVNGSLLPTAMIGSNGGAITMAYRDYCEGASCLRVFRHRTALSAVRDTLGRYVTFHYYGDNDYPVDAAGGRPAGELAAIKAPNKDGVQQEVIRVEYQPIILKYDFGSIAVEAPANNSQIQVVRRIYYPQTGKGFLFSHYSSYGMPRKISTYMGINGPGGTITDGTEIAYTKYNYTTIDPSDPYGRHQVGSLSDFPQFTHREEWWQDKTNAEGEPATDPTTYIYSRTTGGSTEEMTMEYVGKECKDVTTTGTDSGQLSFGKVISVERKSTTGATLGKQVFTYMTGPGGEVEIEKIEMFDEEGQGTLVSFGYGPYGRVTDRYEYGYKQGGVYQVRRRTQSEYVDDALYLAERFLRLVSRVIVYDAKNNTDNLDDEKKAETVITYDGYAAMGGMQNYGLIPSLYPPNHDAAYDQNKVIRGNVTAVKTFSKFNPEEPEEEEATTRRVKYDIFGNVVEAELSCCVKKFFGFSSVTAYSQPDWVRSGPETGLNLQTAYQYNDFTGLVDEERNPDGLRTLYEYDGALRLKKVTDDATDAEAETLFQDNNGNDLLTYVSKARYDDQGTERVITSKQWFDGSGRVIRAGTGTGDTPDSYDMTATVYDGWGRVTKQSNPYPGDVNGNGSPQFWTINTYDELSRVEKVTLPGTDNQTIQTAYSGATSTSGATVVVTDTVGRKRQSEVDGFGRLVKVIEQNPANGNLEWGTSYSYDILNNLTQTDQGGQTRTFEYDAKSRLTRETTPEAGKTEYTYTDFDAVETRTDARKVVATYTYGPLNLLTGVSYNTTNALGVAATAPVNIVHKTASPGKGQIETVTSGVGNENSESYSYDSFGRVQSRVQMIDGIRYETQYEYNAAGQMTLMIYPSGKRVKAGRDARGRLSAIERVDASDVTQESYLSQINYRVDGLISSRNLGDGTTESFGYSNDRLQLTLQEVKKGDNTLLSLSYGYQAGAGQMGSGSTPGNSGQLVSVSGTINGQSRNQAFRYDNVGRLVTATGWGAWERRFDYDRQGNQTAVWDAVSGGNPLQNTVVDQQAGGMKTNRIASMNGTAFSYDASGNVTGDGARAYTYDAENRSVIVSLSGLGSESYGYAAGNRRVKKEVEGVVTHYVWEGNQVIAEYEYGGATSAIGTRYYHQDRLSTRVITDGAGNVVGTADHLPFGENAGGIGESEKHKFTTYERDGAGLDYAVNRHYGPQQGRFNQADPLGLGASSLADPQTLNLYAYVANDPVNMVDPLGLHIESDGGVPGSTIICGLAKVGEDADEQPVYVLECIFVNNAFIRMGRRPTNVFKPPKEAEKTDPAPQEPSTICPPTGAQLANDPVVVQAMQQAWRESRIGTRDGVRREQGGWIYARNGRTIIRRARPGASASIDLTNPPQVRGALLVGNFHTHPGFAAQGFGPGPSDADNTNATRRNIPGLLISEGMIINPYGPNRRGSNPESALPPSDPRITGYPGNSADTTDCP